MWIVKTQHNSSAEISIKKAVDKEDAIKKLAKFYKSYDFKIVDDKLQDADDRNASLDVKYDRNKNVISFVHADGDGPVGSIENI